jgi:hypothetical protein
MLRLPHRCRPSVASIINPGSPVTQLGCGKRVLSRFCLEFFGSLLGSSLVIFHFPFLLLRADQWRFQCRIVIIRLCFSRAACWCRSNYSLVAFRSFPRWASLSAVSLVISTSSLPFFVCGSLSSFVVPFGVWNSWIDAPRHVVLFSPWPLPYVPCGLLFFLSCLSWSRATCRAG